MDSKRNRDSRACELYDSSAHVWGAVLGYNGDQRSVAGFEGDSTAIRGVMVAADDASASKSVAGGATL